MIKDIIVNLRTDSKRDPAGEYALSIASEFEAHVFGTAFTYGQNRPPLVDMNGIMPLTWVEEQRTMSVGRAKAATAKFEENARRLGVPVTTRAGEAFDATDAQAFASFARRFDLAVLSQAGSDDAGGEETFIEAALFDSGRPVLMVPFVQAGGLKLDCITVCWDGSRSAARAIADAMPFLKRAKKIEIVIVTTEMKTDEVEGADIAAHLVRYGLNVEVERIVNPPIDVADTILSHVADAGSDLIVMGAYGHSRLREFILGGVTRGILSSMTLPTLMSH